MMNYLSIENLSKSYGEKLLFEDISFGISKGQKVALIAKNGTGKTTLLNLIMGKDIPDSGTIILRNDIKIAYLPQLDDLESDTSVLDTVFDMDTPVIHAIKQYEFALVEAANHLETHSEKLAHAMVKMDNMNAWNFEYRAKEILTRFEITDMFQNVQTLSGGQKKKLALAKTLLSKSDFLILDEPTNHLDIEMIEWIENYLSQTQITLLMVTHDRYFLDKVCNQILEIDGTSLYKYKGNYDYYLEKKAERIANEAAEFEKNRNCYRKELEWMRSSPQARTSKSKSRIDAFYKLKDNISNTKQDNSRNFILKPERMGHKILEINHVDFAFDDKVILKDFSYIFKKGEKCGIIGKNGIGKSTLLNLIMQELQPQKGKITAGTTLVFGYYNQEGLKNVSGKRVIDIVKEYAEVIRMESGQMVATAQFLNSFGFDYNKQYAYFENLSGGEKRKLFLITILMKNPNFLILDEPTNDFDIETMHQLEDFLTDYQGCLLVVSHDRWFMDKLVDHIFVFQGNGEIRDFYGSYTQYKDKLKQECQISRKSEKSMKINLKKENHSKTTVKLTYKETKELEQLEGTIEALEIRQKTALEILNSGSSDAQLLLKTSEDYADISKLLDEKTMRWLELSEKQDRSE